MNLSQRFLLLPITVGIIALLLNRRLLQTVMSTHRTIVVGGGLAGLSAAHTLLEKGTNVLLLDKKPS